MTYLSVYGHVAIDQILGLVEFPEPNTSVDVVSKRRQFGGTGANMATVAASLGVPTALCSFVGEDFPEDFLSYMESRGVVTDELAVAEGYETSTVIIVSNRHQEQIAYVYQGPMADMDSMPPLLGNARESKVVHLSTGQPDYYLNVMREVRSPGRLLVIDPAQEVHRMWDTERFREAAAMADMAFANRHELDTMLRYLDVGTVEEALETIPTIVVTHGAEGSVVHTAGERVEVPAVPSEVMDATGAGDAFRAGVYAGMYRGMPLPQAAVIGAAAASFVIEGEGGMSNLPSWEGVRERAEPFL